MEQFVRIVARRKERDTERERERQRETERETETEIERQKERIGKSTCEIVKRNEKGKGIDRY